MIELRTLGTVDVSDPSGHADVAAVRSRPKSLALLVYLALASRKGPVRRDTLLGLFWPELSEERARRALSQTLYTLRGALGADVLDGSGHEDLRTRDDALECDACAFLDALEDDRGVDAIALYAGDLLEGFHLAGCPEFDRWADEQRSGLRRSAVRTALGLARESAEAGDAMEVARSVRWALAQAPHDEGVLRVGLALLDRVGNRPAALDAYEAFAGRLEEELELEPSAETERLVGRMRGRTPAGTEGHPSAQAGIPAANESERSPGEAGDISDLARGDDALAREPFARTGGSAPDSTTARAPRPRALPWLAAAAIITGVVALVVWRPWAGETSGSSTSPPADATTTAPAVNADRPRIAVLPLENLSASEENAYLAAGLHEELLRRLSLVRSLAVISRTSVLRFAETETGVAEIAADLAVRYVVEGTVQKDGGRVRIHVQLIDAVEDRHLWAERYDRAFDDLFAIQSEISEAIAAELEAVITPEERTRIEARPTEDPIAYDLYLRGVAMGRSVREEFDAGNQLLHRATERDPGFALAHAGLGWRFWVGWTQHEYPPRDSALHRAEVALELDPALSDAHAVKGWVLASTGRNDSARVSLQGALALNPDHGLAWAGLAALGWWTGEYVSGALAGRRSQEVDPHGAVAAIHLGNCLHLVGLYDEASRWYGRAARLDPGSLWGSAALMWVSLSTGDVGAADRHAARMRQLGADNSAALYLTAVLNVPRIDLDLAESLLRRVVVHQPFYAVDGFPTAQAVLGWVQAQSGKPEGRERLEDLRRVRMEQLDQGYSSYTLYHDLIVASSVLGSEEEQLGWFLEATGVVESRILYVSRYLPWLDRIRNRPEFRSWVEGTEQRMAAQRAELRALGEWTPEAVLGSAAGGALP